MNGCGFWGLAQPNEAKGVTPPTDKPPDSRQQKQQQQPAAQQQQSSDHNGEQHQQAYQSVQQQQQVQQLTYQEQPGQPKQAYHEQQYQYPLQPQHLFPQHGGNSQQFPMSMGGYNGTPVYVVMQSPNGAPPNGTFIPEFLRNFPYGANQKGVTVYELPEGVQQIHSRGSDSVTLSAASSDVSRWSASGDTPKYEQPQTSTSSSPSSSGSHDDRSGAARARWGDRGVGVGHLWAPGEETAPGNKSNEVLPPAWAEPRDDENVLPGAPLSKPGQRTYARGGGKLRMDPEELAEKERRKKQAEETQKIIRQQLEDKKKQKAVEEERERKEAAMWEERVKEQQEREAREYKEEMRKKREKEENEERKQKHLESAIKEAEDKAKKEKEKSRYGHAKNPSLKGTTLPDVGEEVEGDDGEEEVHTSPREPMMKHQRKGNQRQPSMKRLEQDEPPEDAPVEENLMERQELQQQHVPLIQYPPVQKVISNEDERTRLLRSLGITPEMLLASSGLLDRTTLLTLLSAATGKEILLLKFLIIELFYASVNFCCPEYLLPDFFICQSIQENQLDYDFSVIYCDGPGTGGFFTVAHFCPLTNIGQPTQSCHILPDMFSQILFCLK
ncbi:hypothetical protein SK128_008491 [Halocaridina rubra]|uniref:CCDC66 domain-containing protein n=1 Tax=Halocaridina rubra TaxID=373956 RepID=A0AAN8WXT1_HALRR